MKMIVMPSRFSSREVAEERLDLLRDEHGGGLVEDQDPCAPVEDLQDLDPLALADAERLDERVGIDRRGRSRGPARVMRRPGLRLKSIRPRRRGSSPRMMFSSTVRLSASMKCWCTMPMPAAMASVGLRKCADLAVDGDRALVGALHPVEDLHERRLAGAVLADDGVDRAGADPEVHVAVGHDAGEPLDDAGQLDRRWSRLGRWAAGSGDGRAEPRSPRGVPSAGPGTTSRAPRSGAYVRSRSGGSVGHLDLAVDDLLL